MGEAADARVKGTNGVKKRAVRGVRTTKKRVNTALDDLTRAELVRALEANAYLFKHALVQDTAYHSLLKHERKRLHRAIGDMLERIYAKRADEFSAELARHYAEANDDVKTAEYAQRAGNQAARVFAYAEAAAHYEQALRALERLPDTMDRRRQRVDQSIQLVAASIRFRGPEWSLEQLRAAENLLRGLDGPEDRNRLARVHFWMGDAYSHLNQQHEAIAYLQQVLDAGIDDETLLAIPLNVIGRALAAQGKFNRAQPLLEQAAPLLEKSANWYEWVLGVSFLGFVLGAQGDTEGGLQVTARALDRAQELGTPFGIADGHILTSFLYALRQEHDKSLEHGNRALDAAQQVGDQLLHFIAQNAVAWAHANLGRFEEAEAGFQRAQEIAAHAGGQLFFTDLFQAAYAELALRQGAREEAITRAKNAVQTARAVGSLFSEGLAQRVWGQAVADTNRAQAREHLEASIQLFEAGNAQIESARSRAALVRIADESAA